MHAEQDTAATASRRRFLRLSGGGLLLIPALNLAGCSQESAPEPAAPAGTAAPAAAEPAAAAPMPSEAPAAPALVKLDENDSTAVTLGYKHAAADVNADRYARYEPGQKCANCNLFQPDSSPEAGWGACSIFPGKLVNAEGWCNVYVAKA
jgi:hypothetical protein